MQSPERVQNQSRQRLTQSAEESVRADKSLAVVLNARLPNLHGAQKIHSEIPSFLSVVETPNLSIVPCPEISVKFLV